MKNKFEYAVFIFFAKLIGLFPVEKIKYPAKIFSLFFYYFIPIRKEKAFQNIKTAFPDFSNKEIRDVLKGAYLSFTTTIFESFATKNIDADKLKKRVSISNPEIVENKLRQNQNFILLTAHYGNWEIGAMAFGLIFNAQVNVLAKPQRNPYVTEWFDEFRSQFTNKVIPLGMSIRQVYSVIKKNGILGIVGDQRGPKESARVNFFGRKTAVYHGTAEFALKSKTPIICTFVERQPDFTYKLKMKEIDLENLSGSNEEKVIAVTQKFMHLLEEQIKTHPEQWFWMHNIWKY